MDIKYLLKKFLMYISPIYRKLNYLERQIRDIKDIIIYQSEDIRVLNLLRNNNNIINNAFNKNILLIEPNMLYHGECLPSYVNFLNKFGYHIDVVLSRHNFNLNPFCRLLKENHNYECFPFYNYMNIKILSQDRTITERYDKILISTAVSLEGDLFAENIMPKNKIITIVHSLASINDFDMIKKINNQIFLLSYFNNNTYKMINPHYFGNINHSKKLEKSCIKFITVGRMYKDVKNYILLETAIKKLLDNGIKNFEITCIGWEGDIKFQKSISNYITIEKKLCFDELFFKLESSDFYLSLLDPNNALHLKYCNDLISGSNQLVLAFRKPYIISKFFADAYKYNKENAIIYEGNLLYEGMINAITMSYQCYSEMQNNITKLSKKLYNISIKNLKEALNDIQ
jgi:hypothetical protein